MAEATARGAPAIAVGGDVADDQAMAAPDIMLLSTVVELDLTDLRGMHPTARATRASSRTSPRAGCGPTARS